MKFLKRIIISLLCIVVVIGVAVIGGYYYVRSQYGIDLFRTVGQLKTLTQSADESSVCPNAFGEEDFVGLKTSLNGSLKGEIVKFVQNEGYNGYSVDFGNLPTDPSVLLTLSSSVKIAEKQTGALAQIIFYNQTGGKIQIGDKTLNIVIKQIDFSEVAEDGSANFNIVVKIDLTALTDGMTGFPLNLLKKYIPESLYFSSTVRVNKTDADMGYTVTHKELRISNLTADDTEDLFHTLDAIIKIGSAQDLNVAVGTAVTDVLIGNEENTGFAYSVKEIYGSFKFITESDIDYFVIEK